MIVQPSSSLLCPFAMVLRHYDLPKTQTVRFKERQNPTGQNESGYSRVSVVIRWQWIWQTGHHVHLQVTCSRIESPDYAPVEISQVSIASNVDLNGVLLLNLRLESSVESNGAEHPVQAVIRHHVDAKLDSRRSKENCRPGESELFNSDESERRQGNVLVSLSSVQRQNRFFVLNDSLLLNFIKIHCEVAIVEAIPGQPLVAIAKHSEQ